MSKEILPQNIDGYKVLKQLGRGSFAHVFLVEDKYDSSRLYALKKILKPQWSNYIDEEIRALEIMSSYPYAPKLHHVERNVGRNKEQVYLLMDYVPGSDIRRYIRKQGLFNEAQAFKFLTEILAELSFIHSHSMLHLDIKMTNIMRFKNKFCLIDWGVSRSEVCVKTANLLGGTRYLAPETYQGFRCAASEIYSLGCVLYYCVSGKYLFGLKKNDLLEQKIYATTYLTPAFNFPITEKLKYILQRMLEKDPLKRATIEEIENIIAGEWQIEPATELGQNNAIPESSYAIYKQMAEDDKHLVYAQYRLAYLFEKGDEVEQDIEQAMYWYKKSAIAGYALSQHRLGFLYFSGRHGIKRSFKNAFYWFSKGANQKYRRSQYYLGKMYELGKGLKANKNKAIEFYTAAMKNSDLKAEERLQVLLSK